MPAMRASCSATIAVFAARCAGGATCCHWHPPHVGNHAQPGTTRSAPALTTDRGSARSQPAWRSTTAADTRSPGAAYGTKTTRRPSWASASKPKVRRSTSRRSGSVNAGLAEEEEHLLGGEEVGREPAQEIALDDAARRDLDVARHELGEAPAEEAGRAPVDRVDRAPHAESRAGLARGREEKDVPDLEL